MKVYTLTRLTRRIDEQRRVVIQGFEVRARLLKVLLVGLVPSVVIALAALTVIGTYSVLVFAAAEAGFYLLVERRARNGLRLRTYQTIVDRSRSRIGTFACCGLVVDPSGGEWGSLLSSSVPVPLDHAALAARLEAAWDTPPGRGGRRR